MKSITEIGSEYHWLKVPSGPCVKWPGPHVMLSTGRAALLAIFRALPRGFSKVLFVPQFFCEEVISWCIRKGITIKTYIDSPNFPGPIWSTLYPKKNDAILAVNFFGAREGAVWRYWKKENPSTYLIEDHTHDPVSAWALNSEADFAFASLRKTFPISDGSILWSPINLPLPKEPVDQNWNAAALKLAAMILKKDYLENNIAYLKSIYRNFQKESEISLANTISAISPWSKCILKNGYPLEWRLRRESNVKLFLHLAHFNSFIKPLFVTWPRNHCPFNVILKFESLELRDIFKNRLIANNIYPAIHWDITTESGACKDLSKKILTIAADQRYDSQDMYYIASTFNDIKKSIFH